MGRDELLPATIAPATAASEKRAKPSSEAARPALSPKGPMAAAELAGSSHAKPTDTKYIGSINATAGAQSPTTSISPPPRPRQALEQLGHQQVAQRIHHCVGRKPQPKRRGAEVALRDQQTRTCAQKCEQAAKRQGVNQRVAHKQRMVRGSREPR